MTEDVNWDPMSSLYVFMFLWTGSVFEVLSKIEIYNSEVAHWIDFRSLLHDRQFVILQGGSPLTQKSFPGFNFTFLGSMFQKAWSFYL